MNSATNGQGLYQVLTKEDWHVSRQLKASVYVYMFVYTVLYTVLKYSRKRVYQVKQSGPVEAETRHRSALKSPFNMISFPVDKGKRENEGVGLFGFYKKSLILSLTVLLEKMSIMQLDTYTIQWLSEGPASESCGIWGSIRGEISHWWCLPGLCFRAASLHCFYQ